MQKKKVKLSKSAKGALLYMLVVLSIFAVLETVVCSLPSYFDESNTEAYDWLSIVRLHEDKIVLWAMFTRQSYSYADMKYIGIDYSLIEGRPEFWIYFSTNPVPVEYTHKIAAYRINKGFLRILYTPKNYELLIRNTPPEISRQLRKCYSTVLAYKADR